MAPTLMTEHVLNPLKGAFDIATSLDFAAKKSSNVTFDIPAGRVVHINAQQEFETGHSGTKVPMFLSSSTAENDVSNPGTSTGGKFVHQAVYPTGVCTAMVGLGGYELESTEFDAEPAVAYAPNQLLIAKTVNNNSATGGVLSNDRNGVGGSAGAPVAFTHSVCGVVSRGKYLNEHGVEVLAFWTYWLPGT